MFRISFFAAGVLLIAASVALPAGIATAANSAGAGKPSYVEVAPEKKSETVTQKVKRVWHDITTPNYDFCVACPALIPMSHQTCTTQAKNQSAARAQCVEQHPFCSVSETAKRC